MATALEIITAIDDAILNLANADFVSSYSVAGRNLQRYSLAELRDLRKSYASLAASQDAAGGRNRATFGGGPHRG